MLYYWLKQIHFISVLLSFALFIVRGAWVLSGRSLPRHPALRALPHTVDMVLLGSAIWLTTLIQQYPFRKGPAVIQLSHLDCRDVLTLIVALQRVVTFVSGMNDAHDELVIRLASHEFEVLSHALAAPPPASPASPANVAVFHEQTRLGLSLTVA